MTTREDRIKAAAKALAKAGLPFGRYEAMRFAGVVLDAVLPEITTTEQLETLPVGTWLVAADAPRFLRRVIFAQGTGSAMPALSWEGEPYALDTALSRLGPLTIVWQPKD